MKLHFYGAARTTTGANYLLEIGQTKILIDCGLFQGVSEEKNYQSFSYDPKEIDLVLITHAHLDHVGRLPKLLKEGFRGKIFATAPTVEFTRLLLEDSQRILEEKAVKAGVIPLLDHWEIEELMKLFVAVEYNQEIELAKNVLCFFRDAGHILGSSIIEVWAKKQPRQTEFTKIVFTGDLGNPYFSFNILNKPYQIENADYAVIEATYGDRVHQPEAEAKDLLEDAIETAVARGGVLMIPSFALERTQQLLYHLNELAENHRIPYVPIYVDSPLAIKLTELYQKYNRFLGGEAKHLIAGGESIFKFPGLSYTISVNESKMINRVPPPKIIIASSAMSQGGRIVHHEARYLPDPKNMILLVSYQAEGTLGRKISEGDDEVRIADQMVPVRAEIKYITGYSGHADQAALLNWLSRINKPIHPGRTEYGGLKKVFVVQGEEKNVLSLKQMIMDNLGVAAEAPRLNEIVDL